MLDAIDAVDWGAIPGRSGWYEPDRLASGLRALTAAANLVQAADAGSLLGDGGVVHGHSAAVFPAAAVAAPLLLDVVLHGHPAARGVALDLLDQALSFLPHQGYTRVATPYGEAIAICCAVAGQLRSWADVLAGVGRRGASLLAAADQHWCFEVRECFAAGAAMVAFGVLSGRLPPGSQRAERHTAGCRPALADVALEYPAAEQSGEACLTVSGRSAHHLAPGARLFPADCGQSVQ